MTASSISTSSETRGQLLHCAALRDAKLHYTNIAGAIDAVAPAPAPAATVFRAELYVSVVIGSRERQHPRPEIRDGVAVGVCFRWCRVLPCLSCHVMSFCAGFVFRGCSDARCVRSPRVYGTG